MCELVGGWMSVCVCVCAFLCDWKKPPIIPVSPADISLPLPLISRPD